jgi:hypothetical protein
MKELANLHLNFDDCGTERIGNLKLPQSLLTLKISLSNNIKVGERGAM